MPPRKLKIVPKPDFTRLDKVLRRQGIPDRVPFYELFSNIETEVMRTIGQNKEKKGSENDQASEDHALKQHIDYMLNLGYDYVNTGGKNFNFPQKELPKTMTNQGERSYFQGSSHTIANREDFEKYAWPKMEDVDYSPVEKVSKVIPEGMKAISITAGIFEHVRYLLGYEGLFLFLYDDKQLVKDMFEAVATRIIKYFDTLASFEVVGALVICDDLGFKTQSMLSPQLFREYVFPWYRKFVETVHRHNKPIALHACGNLNEVMEDIIDCGWDARHSFEDVIEPVCEAKEKYGDRIALLGGFDMDKICRMSEDEVRTHTRWLIEKCAPGGGWALGTGNSVANYVPINNFLAMQEEGYLAGHY